MNRIPEEPHSRQAWLARWGEEKAKQSELAHLVEEQPVRSVQHVPIRVRLATRIASWVDSAARRWDPMFDRGLDTSGNVTHPESLAINAYAPSRWHVLPRALRAIDASDGDVLVDYGCGKGRIVHQAAKWPLKRVIGVEISPELAGLAQTLVDAHRHEYRCGSVEIVVCDAARFQVPDDLTIGYFFDPFYGETLDAVLRNIIASIDRRPRRVRLLCVMSRGTWQVLAMGRFRLVGQMRVTRHYRAAIFENW